MELLDMDNAVCTRCGNNTDGSGFDTCDEMGFRMEPLATTPIGSGYWEGHYICNDCDKVYDSPRDYNDE